MHQVARANGEVLLSAKVPKLYVDLQNLEKKNLVDESVLKKSSVNLVWQKIPSKMFKWDTRLYTAPEEYFSSTSTKKLRILEKFHSFSHKETMLVETFR